MSFNVAIVDLEFSAADLGFMVFLLFVGCFRVAIGFEGNELRFIVQFYSLP